MARALDHLVLPARDLAAQAAFYRRLGFQVGARNRHPWGTENHIVQFDGVFLELIGLGEGFVAPAPDAADYPFAGFLARSLKVREGLAMIVLRSHDAEADRQEFSRRGLGGFARFDFGRKGRRPDGSVVEVAFSLAFAASPEWPDTGFFVCQQHFPENFWSAAAQVHANGARGVSRVEFVHPRPRDGAAFLEAFADSVGEGDGDVVTLPLDNSRLAVARGGAAHASALEFSVADLAALARAWDAQSVPYVQAGGALEIAARDAFGVTLRFVG